MNTQQKKNRQLIMIIFGMSIIPFLIAWYLKEHPELMSARTNNGELIIPPIVTERTDLSGFDNFSKENLNELNGRWVLVNVMPNAGCNDVCRDAMYKSKQLLLMMGKDLTRIRRVVLMFESVPQGQAEEWWRDDTRLLRAKPIQTLKDKLNAIEQIKMVEGMLFIMDPFGNVMMYYESGFDPYKVKSDLKKLLNISQIG
ncbi:MAG: hypothetical protein ACU85E_08060 [Gammaproteobacteria bacterium]